MKSNSSQGEKLTVKNVIRGFFRTILATYILSLIAVTPYFNWQYAKHNGFKKWLFLGEIVATAKSLVWPYYIFAKDVAPSQPTMKGKISEYTDKEYGYAFQFPSAWEMVRTPPKGEAGEVRVFMKGPKSMTLMVIVGKLETSVSKQAFAKNPYSEALVDDMINFTIETVYKKTSRDIGASRMVVGEQRAVRSDVGIKFFVSTAHFIKTKSGELPVVASGIHYIPFEKNHMIIFLMTSPVNPNANEEKETFTAIFNSFHLVGETPQ